MKLIWREMKLGKMENSKEGNREMTGVASILDIVRTDVNTAKRLARHVSAKGRIKSEMMSDLDAILEKLENIERLLGYGTSEK